MSAGWQAMSGLRMLSSILSLRVKTAPGGGSRRQQWILDTITAIISVDGLLVICMDG